MNGLVGLVPPLERGGSMLRSTLNCIVISILLILAGAISCVAQTTQGGIVGAIRDEKGANIPAAKVTVSNTATGLQRETTTAGNGLFRLMALPTGTYQVKAEAPGFATATAPGIEVGVDQIRT